MFELTQNWMSRRQNNGSNPESYNAQLGSHFSRQVDYLLVIQVKTDALSPSSFPIYIISAACRGTPVTTQI